MPPALQAALYDSTEEKKVSYFRFRKEKIIKAAQNELQSCNDLFNVPSFEELMNATKENQLEWDPVSNFKRSLHQSEESYNEQLIAVKHCVSVIDRYCSIEHQYTFQKSVVLVGAPGSGKSFINNSYLPIYAISKGLNVTSMTVMSKRGINVGGGHIHKDFCLQVSEYGTPHDRADRAITNLMRNPVKLFYLQSLNVIFIDEIGQISADMKSVLDIILRKIRDNNIFFGGLLIIATMDHRQLAPVSGHPFLVASDILTCFEFVRLNYSIRASGDPEFQRLQFLSRLHPTKYTNEILNEFEELLSKVRFLCICHCTENANEFILPISFDKKILRPFSTTYLRHT